MIVSMMSFYYNYVGGLTDVDTSLTYFDECSDTTWRNDLRTTVYCTCSGQLDVALPLAVVGCCCCWRYRISS